MSNNANVQAEATIAYQVSDMKASQAWYAKHLGFELKYEVVDYGWCEMSTTIEGVFVGLSQVEEPKVEGGGTVTWSTPNAQESMDYLKASGVKVDEMVVLPGLVKLVMFYDPDGNHLMLAESLGSQEA
jgi:catechol 2,3-dioxygenase-like lactoylglutathione lyase family enzyme